MQKNLLLVISNIMISNFYTDMLAAMYSHNLEKQQTGKGLRISIEVLVSAADLLIL